MVISKHEIQEQNSKLTTTHTKSISLEELIKQQNVTPISNLDEISDLWPTNDDPDFLLAYLLALRAERREFINRKK